MTRRVIAIRPEPGCSATVAAAAAIGLKVEPWPLFDIRPVPWITALPEAFDGLLIGSANAIRHAGAELARWRGKPVYAVGQATARAAEQAGLTVATAGAGGLQQLLDVDVPRPSRLLRLAGADHVTLDVPAEIGLETRIVYESRPRPVPDLLAQELTEGAIVLLHSAVAAQHFAAQCDARLLDRQAMALAALGPRIARAAGPGWSAVHTAESPSEPAILALAKSLCHEP